jgi:hypothetical protein
MTFSAKKKEAEQRALRPGKERDRNLRERDKGKSAT